MPVPPARSARLALLCAAVALAAACKDRDPGPPCGSGCLVNGVCVAEGDACDEGLFCTVAGRCFAGRCSGEPRDCDDRIACNGVETCDEATRACKAGTPTCALGEVCDATANACVTPCLGCSVGGTCWKDGQVNPLDQCQGCDTAKARFAWSARDGLPCDDGLFCTVNDACSAGTCAGSARSCSDGLACNGLESCDEGLKACKPGVSPCGPGTVCDAVADACTQLVCTGGCLVGNVCWGSGQLNPSNPCQRCVPALAAAAWTPLTGVACDDGLWCTVNDTCSAGTCAGSARSCSDGRSCNGVETCDEAADACTPHPNASCEASAVCADACSQLGQVLPYFVTSVQPAAFPTAGGATVTLRGVFGSATGATLVDQATGQDLTGSVTFWTQDTIQLVVPAGALDRELVLTAAGGVAVPFVEEVVMGWQRAFVQHATIPVRYLPPTVTRVAGCVDDTATRAVSCSVSGQQLDVYGTQLGNAASAVQVTVGGLACAPVTIQVPHTRLRCTLPPSPTGGFDLPVTVRVGGRAGTLAGGVSYFGPEIGAVSPAMVTSVALDPRGGDTVAVGGRFFGTDLSAIQVQLGDDPRLVATAIAVSQDPQLFGTVTFRAPPGVGTGYPVRVRVGLLTTRSSADTLSYRLPVLLPGTVRGGLATPGSTLYTTGTPPAPVFVDVRDAGTRGADLVVRLVDFAGEEVPCLDPALVTTAPPRSSLSCRLFTNLSTRDVPLGGAVFRIGVPSAVSSDGTDQVWFPQAPLVSGISGCVDAGATTHDCPTAGGVPMTLGAAYLAAPFRLFVGGTLVDATLAPPSAFFVLPPGVGSARVVLRLDGLSSSPATIDYAAPSIAAVSGCVDWQGTTGDCPLAGGTTLALTGTDFGASGAVVFVGASPCPNVVHDAATPHQRLTCTLPAGAGSGIPVLVVNGKLSKNAGSLSYHLP